MAKLTTGIRVNTSSGILEGIAKPGLATFLGVPYAAPPTGSLRWQDPQPPAHWSGVRAAKSFGPPCIQFGIVPNSETPTGGTTGSEDCLYLNVWAPRDRATSHAVLFFVHGGDYIEGSGQADELAPSIIDYDGSNLATRAGIVVVTINYRLGIMGFLAHPELTRLLGHSGNFGFLDQIAALDWVHENIAAFGGDPNRITVFGEWAGAFSVASLIASPRTKGKIFRAIMDSGNFTSAASQAQQEQVWEPTIQKLASLTGCAESDVGCLRNADAGTLVLHEPAVVGLGSTSAAGNPIKANVEPGPNPYLPAIDGSNLPDIPLNVIASGRSNVPILLFANSGELESGNLPPDLKALSADQVATDLNEVYAPASAQAILGHYFPASVSTASGMGAFLTDLGFICSGRRQLRVISQRVPVQAGIFAQSPAMFYELLASLKSGNKPNPPGHGTELIYVFQHVQEAFSAVSQIASSHGKNVTLRPTPADLATERVALDVWTRFAKGENEPWGTFFANGPYGVVQALPRVAPSWNASGCDILDSAALQP